MDTRIELQKNDRLLFPGMECTIDHSVGRGSNVIVYVGHYRDHQNPSLSHRVLIRELFPYDREGGIWRNPDGDIHIESTADSVYDLNRMTFLRGNEVHIRLLEKIPADMDVNINTYEYHNTLYSLVGYAGGRNLYEELSRAQWQGQSAAGTELLLHTVRIMKGALDVLQSFHQAGYLHLDINPDNILLIGEGEKERVTLIDYNSVHTINEIEQKKSVYYSTKEGFTAPEVQMGRFSRIGEWTDLYSLTAMLYVCLTGRKLTTVQMIGNSPVSLEPAEFPFLKDFPETVLSLLHRILRRGLEITPRRRYQSTKQMRADISELEDRILGRGITHWALWEAGRARIRRSLNENPALDYLKDEKRIYPLYAMSEDGERIPLLQHFLFDSSDRNPQISDQDDSQKTNGSEPASRGGAPHAPVLLLGGGGTGKTTTLLRIACGQNRRYTPASAIVYYISLYGYRDKEQNYICDRLLESLKFKPHTDSMESARRELMQLLDRLVRGQILLLLDGLNEASGDTGPLLEEIGRLSGLAGLQIILTSRTDPGFAGYRKLTLCRLEKEEVKRILSWEGILPPENMEVFDLLTFPMLLSMYIRTVQSREQQVRPDSRDQLITEYLAAILEKEKRNLLEENSFYLGCEAAVRYLLPEIAGLARQKKHALSGRELRPLVETCFGELSKRTITTVYPDWIGHTANLRFGARTADEWYGIAVLDLLWKRLGFLVRDEQGNFRILHQMIEDYLAEKSRQFHKDFDREKRREKNLRGFFLLCAGLFLVSGIIGYTAFMNAQLAARRREIIQKDTESLISMSETALENGKRYEAMEAALQALPSEDVDRPVTTKAQHALASSLLTYQVPEYRLTCSIDLPAELRLAAVSESGKYLSVIDKSDVLRCYDGKKGTVLWEKTDIVEGSLYVLEDAGGILVVGASHFVLYSLRDGSIKWKKDCEIKNLYLDGENLLALEEYKEEKEDEEDVEGKDDKEKWLFHTFKTTTGEEMVPAVSFSPDWGDEYLNIPGTGGFIQYSDSLTYFINYRVYESNDAPAAFLDWINTATGECVRSTALPMGEGEGNTFYNLNISGVNMKYIVPDQKTWKKGGLFVCMACPRPLNNPELIYGFVEDGNDRFKYSGRIEPDFFNLPETEPRIPQMKVPIVHELSNGRIMILYGGNEIIIEGKDGREYVRKLPLRNEYIGNMGMLVSHSDVIGCRFQEDPFRLFILYEDGTAESSSRANVSLRLTDTGIAKTSAAGMFNTYGLCSRHDAGSTMADGLEKYGAAFCLVLSSDQRRIYVAEYAGDRNGESISDASFDSDCYPGSHLEPTGKKMLWQEVLNSRADIKFDDLTGQNLFIFPEQGILASLGEIGEMFLTEDAAYSVSISDLMDLSVSKKYYFSFPDEYSEICGLSEDGKILYFKDFSLDLESGERTEYVEKGTASDDSDRALNPSDNAYSSDDAGRIFFSEKHFICEDSEQLYSLEDGKWELENEDGWDGEKLHWMFDGKVHTVSFLHEGENILDHRVLEQYLHYYYSMHDIVSGDNGLLFVSCTGREKGKDDLTDVEYFMVYSLETEQWTRIDVPAPYQGRIMPYPAKSSKWFALGCDDSILRIYDLEKGEFIRQCSGKTYNADIQNMEFVMEDRYLVVWGKNNVSVFDTSTGDRLFYRKSGTDSIMDDTLSLKVYEDGEDLYFTGKTGFCLDTEEWEIRYDIPWLAVVTDSWIFTQEGTTITRYPKYTLQDLIQTVQ